MSIYYMLKDDAFKTQCVLSCSVIFFLSANKVVGIIIGIFCFKKLVF